MNKIRNFLHVADQLGVGAELPIFARITPIGSLVNSHGKLIYDDEDMQRVWPLLTERDINDTFATAIDASFVVALRNDLFMPEFLIRIAELVERFPDIAARYEAAFWIPFLTHPVLREALLLIENKDTDQTKARLNYETLRCLICIENTSLKLRVEP